MDQSFSSTPLTTGDQPETSGADHSLSTEISVQQHTSLLESSSKPSTHETTQLQSNSMATPGEFRQAEQFSTISTFSSEQSPKFGNRVQDIESLTPNLLNYNRDYANDEKFDLFDSALPDFLEGTEDLESHNPTDEPVFKDEFSPKDLNFAIDYTQPDGAQVFDPTLLDPTSWTHNPSEYIGGDADESHHPYNAGDIAFNAEYSGMYPDDLGLVAVPGSGEQLKSTLDNPAYPAYAPIDYSGQWGTCPLVPSIGAPFYPEPWNQYPQHRAPLPQYVEPPNQQQPYYRPTPYTSGLGLSQNAFDATGRAYDPADMYGEIPQPMVCNKRHRSSFMSSPDRPEKRARIDSRFEDPSEDELSTLRPSRKPRSKKRSRPESRRSSDLTDSPPVKFTKQLASRTGQLPERSEERPWLRINGNTKGETTRTARIHDEFAQPMDYKYMGLPNGNCWRSDNYKFEYYHALDAHMFKKPSMSTRQVEEYIKQYPSDDLIIWIQAHPADCARRISAEVHDKCLFKDCPKRVYGENGTISVGHYRVAFDEKTKSGGDKINPYDVPAFAHLDCMERFLDFADICQYADVRVDYRVSLKYENSNSVGWGFAKRSEGSIARHFVKLASSSNPDKLRNDENWKNYPVHQIVNGKVVKKNHEQTLVYKLNDASVSRRPPSQLRQFIDRGLTSGTFIVNYGDLEMDMMEKRIMKKPYYKAYVHEHGLLKKNIPTEKWCEWYDIEDRRIMQRINAWYAEYPSGKDSSRKKKKTKAAKQQKQPKKGSNKRSRDEFEESDDEKLVDLADEDDTDDELPHHAPTQGTRISSRKKQKINYAETEREIDSLVDQQAEMHPHIHALKNFNKNPTGLTVLPPAPTSDPSSLAHYTRSQAQNNLPTSGPESRPFWFDAEEELKAKMRCPLTSHSEQLETIFEAPPTPGRRSSTGLLLPPTPASQTFGSPYQTRRRSSANSSSRGRQASFNAQPVSASAEYDVDEPPSAMGTPERRRSSRLASSPK